MLDGPDLRNVRRDGRELAQRVYMAVRDEGWGTTPGEVSDLQVEQRDDGFRVTFTARHARAPIDFEWQAEILGEADGTVTFALDGVAHSAFRYAKIGFNVHHPLLESVGRAFRATGEDGRRSGRIEAQIEPQRVVDGVLTGMFPPYSAARHRLPRRRRGAGSPSRATCSRCRTTATGPTATSRATARRSRAVAHGRRAGQRFSQRVVITSAGLGEPRARPGPSRSSSARGPGAACRASASASRRTARR